MPGSGEQSRPDLQLGRTGSPAVSALLTLPLMQALPLPARFCSARGQEAPGSEVSWHLASAQPAATLPAPTQNQSPKAFGSGAPFLV